MRGPFGPRHWAGAPSRKAHRFGVLIAMNVSVSTQVLEQATVREILMGAQDNLTNVLAVVLGVTIGAGRADFVALAGLSAGIAESVSMGGVLYNATRAEQQMAAQ